MLRDGGRVRIYMKKTVSSPSRQAKDKWRDEARRQLATLQRIVSGNSKGINQTEEVENNQTRS